jgi:hypothetical protein
MTRIVAKERKYLGIELVLIHEAVLDAASAVAVSQSARTVE